MAAPTKEGFMMSWHDCINPFGLPTHGEDFIIGTFEQTQRYASKICAICWYKAQRLVNNPQPITLNSQKSKAYKQAGPDTL